MLVGRNAKGKSKDYHVPAAVPVTSFNFSNLSLVRGSPPSTASPSSLLEEAVLATELTAIGLPDLVAGGLTAVESPELAEVTDAADKLALELVRKAKAARRGRRAAASLGVESLELVPPVVGELLMLIRAAS